MKKNRIVIYVIIIILISVYIHFDLNGFSWKENIKKDQLCIGTISDYSLLADYGLLTKNGYRYSYLFPFFDYGLIDNPICTITFKDKINMASRIKWHIKYNLYFEKNVENNGFVEELGLNRFRFQTECYFELKNAVIEVTYYSNQPIDSINYLKEYIKTFMQREYIVYDS